MQRFPREFLWGVSTSAHQFEGCSPNQWQRWEQEGHIRAGYRSDRCCDWWRSAERDLDLCSGLGLNAIRIAVDWGRLEPSPGEWDDHAACRYRSLLASIASRGMRPFVTLHHFTHPEWFQERGGFVAADAAQRFADFASRVVQEIGSWCTDWLTFNEPNVYASFGYLFGEFPPGHCYRFLDFGRVLANMHLAHALAYDRIHEAQRSAKVGIATNWVDFHAATDAVGDRLLAFMYDSVFNRASLEILHRGRVPFPAQIIMPSVEEAVQKIDFVGLNVYNRLHVRLPRTHPERKTGGLFVPPHVPQGDRGAELPYGEAFPQAITSAVDAYSALNVPLYITENGVPDREDRIRPWVLVQSLARVHECIQAGYNVRGYFHWSIVDNFEWSEGWGLRFGLYELDLQTRERRARPSAALYREIIRNSGVAAHVLHDHADVPCSRFPAVGEISGVKSVQ